MPIISGGSSGSASGGIGSTSLIYRLTVAGADKASIDTAVDTPDAGSNVWTGGDLLEIFIYALTDEAATSSSVATTLNNDGTAVYDLQNMSGNNTTLAAGASVGQASWGILVPGANHAANVFGSVAITMPNYGGTTGFKSATCMAGLPDSTAANELLVPLALLYRSTTAVSRLKITPVTALKKFKVGTQLLIYKRSTS